MISVSYTYEIPYVFRNERPRPILKIEIRNPTDASLAVETDAHLDSGTDQTILQGEFCDVIGLDLDRGREKAFQSAAPYSKPLVARLHRVKIVHEVLGEREIVVAFAAEMRRNLLGLDFFNFFKIGFQDRENRILFEPE